MRDKSERKISDESSRQDPVWWRMVELAVVAGVEVATWVLEKVGKVLNKGNDKFGPRQ